MVVTTGVVYTTGPDGAATNREGLDVIGTDDEQEDGTEHEIGRVQVVCGIQEENDLWHAGTSEQGSAKAMLAKAVPKASTVLSDIVEIWTVRLGKNHYCEVHHYIERGAAEIKTRKISQIFKIAPNEMFHVQV